MAEKINDGGPAYPFKCTVKPGTVDPWLNAKVEDGKEHEHFFPGMTLRDWFAGQFISRFAASDMEPLDVKDAADQFDVDCALREHWDHAARAAYIAADAMLSARNGGDA